MSYLVFDQSAKRVGDIAIAACGLLAAVPLFGLIAIAVRLDSPGPVFFRHRRAGRRGRPFHMLKFRTMVHQAIKIGPEVTVANDDRVTRVGRLLRKSKLDELPQLWNVLIGDMSLVGPRPQSYSYIPCYSETDLGQILSVRPGVTGPTQLWLRHEEELLAEQQDPIKFYTEQLLPLKIESDKAYVRNRNLIADVKCVVSTITAVARLRPAKTETILLSNSQAATDPTSLESEHLETAA